jgi:hypothetical protein
MRALLTLLLLGAAFWRAALDWQATIGEGYAYRFVSLGGAFAARWPEAYARLVARLEASALPWAWDPVGAFVLSLPVALALAALGMTVWVTRNRSRSR